MAAPAHAPTIQGLTGLTFLMTAETGLMLGSFSRNTTRENLFVYDASVGYDVGVVFHNPEATYTVAGKTSGTTGVAAAAPGTALTIANPTTGNGVAGGTVWTTSVGLSHNEKGFREISVNATQKPGIVAA